MITRATQPGFGREVSSIDSENVAKVILHDYIAQAFGLAGGALGRISFIVFIIGLLTTHGRKEEQRVHTRAQLQVHSRLYSRLPGTKTSP